MIQTRQKPVSTVAKLRYRIPVKADKDDTCLEHIAQPNDECIDHLLRLIFRFTAATGPARRGQIQGGAPNSVHQRVDARAVFRDLDDRKAFRTICSAGKAINNAYPPMAMHGRMNRANRTPRNLKILDTRNIWISRPSRLTQP